MATLTKSQYDWYYHSRFLLALLLVVVPGLGGKSGAVDSAAGGPGPSEGGEDGEDVAPVEMRRLLSVDVDVSC